MNGGDAFSCFYVVDSFFCFYGVGSIAMRCGFFAMRRVFIFIDTEVIVCSIRSVTQRAYVKGLALSREQGRTSGDLEKFFKCHNI